MDCVLQPACRFGQDSLLSRPGAEEGHPGGEGGCAAGCESHSGSRLPQSRTSSNRRIRFYRPIMASASLSRMWAFIQSTQRIDVIGPFSGRGFHERVDWLGGLGQELAGFLRLAQPVPGHGEQQPDTDHPGLSRHAAPQGQLAPADRLRRVAAAMMPQGQGITVPGSHVRRKDPSLPSGPTAFSRNAPSVAIFSIVAGSAGRSVQALRICSATMGFWVAPKRSRAIRRTCS